jgi:hypothetical protein
MNHGYTALLGAGNLKKTSEMGLFHGSYITPNNHGNTRRSHPRGKKWPPSWIVRMALAIQMNYLAWIIVKIGNSMINNGNAATCTAIYELHAVGTAINSASTGTSEYYVY